MKKRLIIFLMMMKPISIQASEIGLKDALMFTTTVTVVATAYIAYELYQSESNEEIIKEADEQLGLYSAYRECIDVGPQFEESDSLPFDGVESLLLRNLEQIGVSTNSIDEHFVERIEEDRAKIHALVRNDLWLRSLLFTEIMDLQLKAMKYHLNAKYARTFFQVHPHFIAGHALLNFYKNIPEKVNVEQWSTYDKRLIDWIKCSSIYKNKKQEAFPLLSYVEKVDADIAWVDTLSSLQISIPEHLQVRVDKNSQDAILVDTSVADENSLQGNLRAINGNMKESLLTSCKNLNKSLDRILFMQKQRNAALQNLIMFKINTLKIEQSPQLYPQMMVAIIARRDVIAQSSKNLQRTHEYQQELDQQRAASAPILFDRYLKKSQKNLNNSNRIW